MSEGRRVAIPAELCQEYGFEPGDAGCPGIFGSRHCATAAGCRDPRSAGVFRRCRPGGCNPIRRIEPGPQGGSRAGKPWLRRSSTPPALIAFLRNEPGAEKVASVLNRSCISAVNLAEVLGKMVEYGKELEAVAFQIERLRIPVVPFDGESSENRGFACGSRRGPWACRWATGYAWLWR